MDLSLFDLRIIISVLCFNLRRESLSTFENTGDSDYHQRFEPILEQAACHGQTPSSFGPREGTVMVRIGANTEPHYSI